MEENISRTIEDRIKKRLSNLLRYKILLRIVRERAHDLLRRV